MDGGDIRGKLTTISLSKREVIRIQEIMRASGMKQHQVIKLAVRLFLFPEENRKAQLVLTSANNREVES
jgi:hypothetical protein